MNVRVLIVGGMRLYHEALERSLEGLGFIPVGSAASARDAVAVLADRAPDVVLVDTAGVDASTVAYAITARSPRMPMVALAVPEQEAYVWACAQAGISSYLPRDASLADLAAAIEAAVRGEVHCSPAIAAFVFRHARGLKRPAATPARPALTTRQLEIVELIDQGLSNKEIAGRLFIEVATVKNHVHNILGRLEARRRSAAAALVRGRHGGG